jgi:hypothetical protein
MDASQKSQARTRVFSRVLGPFLVIADATAIARASDIPSLLAQFGVCDKFVGRFKISNC